MPERAKLLSSRFATFRKKTTFLSLDKRLAILDLGTNTFHLDVYEVKDEKVNQLFKTKVFVKLAESGLKKISPGPFERGVDAIKYFKEELEQFRPGKVVAFATAAFREATNSRKFLEQVRGLLGVDVQVISGDQEAELIYHGVKQAVKLDEKPVLIMDIGGGSVEFIIADKMGIKWKKSYLAGSAFLLEHFQLHDPMNSGEVEDMSAYLEDRFSSLFDEIKCHNITKLVGSSGTFDTLAEMISFERGEYQRTEEVPSYPIDLDKFAKIHKRLLKSTLEERLKTKGLIPMRAEMIVIASIMIEAVLRLSSISEMVRSNFSLKEGAAWCILNGVAI